MIPAQAFAFKEYFGGTFSVAKTAGKEHALASLCQVEKLRIGYSPRHTVPARIHFG